jgi:hypothetical protein
MVVAELCSVVIYLLSMAILRTYFGMSLFTATVSAAVILSVSFLDSSFITTWDFAWKVVLLTAVACLPVYVSKALHARYDPSAWSKLAPLPDAE